MNQLHNFASDNYAGAHPRIIEALAHCNEGYLPAYGEDIYTSKAKQMIQQVFETRAEVFFTSNGTAANVLSIASCCQSYEAVLCAESAHIHTDECGAIEKFVGCKIYPIPTPDGKINTSLLEPFLSLLGNVHHNQPRVVSISQPTELGTLYSAQEIKSLAQWAHRHQMFLHIDGARIANATVSLAEPVAQFTTHAGADLVTFGGTKNGMLFGEAIVVLNHNMAPAIKYLQKQSMQLISKMRYIGAQYIAYLNDDLWLQNASHANQMARLLEKKVFEIPSIDIAQKVQANSVFARIPEYLLEPLQEHSYFYRWDEPMTPQPADHRPLVRWMCSFSTQKEHVLDFVETIHKLLQQNKSNNRP